MEDTKWLNKNSGTERLKCIDAFRGMAIALMLFCENPGNPARIYPQFKHVRWNGYSIADLGFPFFIIIMGMVVPYALNKRLSKGDSPLTIFMHILIRSVGIFALGLFLNGFPLYDFSNIRILGVLQRIAICYFIVSSMTLIMLYVVKVRLTQTLVQLGLAFVIIIVYYLLMKYVTVPGFGKGILEPNGNLVQYIDLKLLKGHLYKRAWDPEGILSTLPAIASALFGVVAGQVLMYATNKKIYKFLSIFTFGIITVALAYKANTLFPFNKNLWSSSFVLLTAGLSYVLLSLLYFIMDIIKFDSLFMPFIILGSRSITVYLASVILHKTLWTIPVIDSITQGNVTLNIWLTTKFITPLAGNVFDSAYFSIAYIILWIGIMGIFYNKKPSTLMQYLNS